MPQKFIHKVSPELTDDAQYKSISEIPANALTQGSTVLMYPGAYSAVTVTADNVQFEGVGDRDEITIAGVTLANACANTVSFKNLTINSSLTALGTNATVVVQDCIVNAVNAIAATGTSAIELGTNGTGLQPVLNVYDSTLTGDYGVRNRGAGLVTLTRVDAQGSNKALLCNSAANVNFSMLNTSSNAYFQSGDGTTSRLIVLTASVSGGANGTITTKAVRATLT